MKTIKLTEKTIILIAIVLFIIASFGLHATTSGNAGIFEKLVQFLTAVNDGLKIVFSIGAIACIGFGLFKMLTDPNMGAMITLVIGVALVLALIFGASDIVTGVGGTMIDITSGGI